MADDPIHIRDEADPPSVVEALASFGLRRAGLRFSAGAWIGYSVLGGALVRRAWGLR